MIIQSAWEALRLFWGPEVSPLATGWTQALAPAGWRCALTICFISSLLRHPAQNCKVSEWSFWSGCAAPCTPSFRVRVREVERQPNHSGAPCPRLEQRSGCRDYRDHWGRHCGQQSGKQIITISDLKSAKSNRFNSHRSCVHHQHGVRKSKA